MRNIFLILFVCVLLTPLRAQQLKLGFVEDQRILAQLPAVKEVQKIFDRETAIWDKEFQTKQALVTDLLDSIRVTRGDLNQTLDQYKKVKNAQPADSLSGKAGDAGKESQKLPDTLKLGTKLAKFTTELDSAKKEVVVYYHKFYGNNGLVPRRNAELSQPVLERINQTIAAVGEREGYSMIFDASIVFYLDQDFNLTDELLRELNLEQEQLR